MRSYDPIDEAFQFMKSYLEKSNINLVELFEKFDVDKSMSMTYDEFREGLKVWFSALWDSICCE